MICNALELVRAAAEPQRSTARLIDVATTLRQHGKVRIHVRDMEFEAVPSPHADEPSYVYMTIKGRKGLIFRAAPFYIPGEGADLRWDLTFGRSRPSNHGVETVARETFDYVTGLSPQQLLQLIVKEAYKLCTSRDAKWLLAGFATAAAEPTQGLSMRDALDKYGERLRVEKPGFKAEYIGAILQLRTNSREWEISIDFLLHAHSHTAQLFNRLEVMLNASGLRVRQAPEDVFLGQLQPLADLVETVSGMTFDKADADNETAAKVILSACRKLLLRNHIPAPARAAAEPQAGLHLNAKLMFDYANSSPNVSTTCNNRGVIELMAFEHDPDEGIVDFEVNCHPPAGDEDWDWDVGCGFVHMLLDARKHVIHISAKAQPGSVHAGLNKTYPWPAHLTPKVLLMAVTRDLRACGFLDSIQRHSTGID